MHLRCLLPLVCSLSLFAITFLTILHTTYSICLFSFPYFHICPTMCCHNTTQINKRSLSSCRDYFLSSTISNCSCSSNANIPFFHIYLHVIFGINGSIPVASWAAFLGHWQILANRQRPGFFFDESVTLNFFLHNLHDYLQCTQVNQKRWLFSRPFSHFSRSALPAVSRDFVPF